jgi:type IV secretion system protein VirD4
MNLLDNFIDIVFKFSDVQKRIKFIRSIINDKEKIKKFFVIGLIMMTIIINIFSEAMNSAMGTITQRRFNPLMIIIPNIKFSVFYIIFYVGYGFIFYSVLATLRRSYGKFFDSEKGSARFSTREEIDQQYKSIPKKDLIYPGKGGIPIARNTEKDEIYIDDGAVNNLIIGMTRSGKGQMFVIPMIDILSRSEEQSSMIIHDPKAELIISTKDILEERGFDVYVLNLIDPENSMDYNPLQLILEAYRSGRQDEAQLLCQTLTYSLYYKPDAKDTFWQDAAMSLGNALILAICDECQKKGKYDKVTLYTAANMLADLGGNDYQTEDGETLNALDEYFKRLPKNAPARLQYAMIKFTKGVTRSSVFATAMSELQIFLLSDIAKITSRNTLDFESIGFNTDGRNKPKAVFLVTPDYDKSNNKLVSIFISQIYYALAKKASLSRGGKCEREVAIIVDEAGNLAAIKDLDAMLTVGIGRGIKFTLIIQAFAQLQKLYGKTADTIISNCGNQIYIKTTDPNTNKNFSEQLGDKSESVANVSFDMKNNAQSKNESVQNRRLLNADELGLLQEGETVVMRSMKRRDLKFTKVTPHPIYNNGEYAIEYAYKYLLNFNADKYLLGELNLGKSHADINLDKLLLNPDFDALAMQKSENRLLNKRIYEKNKRNTIEGLFESINNQLVEQLDAQSEPQEIYEVYDEFDDYILSQKDKFEIIEICKKYGEFEMGIHIKNENTLKGIKKLFIRENKDLLNEIYTYFYNKLDVDINNLE